MYGSRPFVDAARVFGLANEVPHTNTAERLRAVAEIIQFRADEVVALTEGFYFIHRLRVRNQRQGLGAEVAAAANRIDPHNLNELDRHILKETFRQARKLQNRLRFAYRM